MKISVLTPSFNGAQYLRRAIESVVRQDYKDWEHIVADGESTDGTVSILQTFSHLIWWSKRDKGQSDAMNQAFDKATGDIIIYLNVDDELEDGLFSRLIKAFEENPSADLIVGNLRVNHLGDVHIRKPLITLEGILNLHRIRFPLNPVSYAYRKALQQKIGPFPVANHYSMDYWFLLRAYLFAEIIKLDLTCGTYFSDGRNKSADLERGLKELKAVRNAFLRQYFYYPQVARYIARKTLKKMI